MEVCSGRPEQYLCCPRPVSSRSAQTYGRLPDDGDYHEPLLFGSCLRPGGHFCGADSIGQFPGQNGNQSTACSLLGGEAAGRRTRSGRVLHRGRRNLAIDNAQDVARTCSDRNGIESSVRSNRRFRLEDENVNFLNPEVAFIDAQYYSSSVDPDGHDFEVMVKREGKWLI